MKLYSLESSTLLIKIAPFCFLKTLKGHCCEETSQFDEIQYQNHNQLQILYLSLNFEIPKKDTRNV